MPNIVAHDRRVYKDVRRHLIKERLEKTPVVNTLYDVNFIRLLTLDAEQVKACIQRHAFYRNYMGYAAMYVRDGIVFFNSC